MNESVRATWESLLWFPSMDRSQHSVLHAVATLLHRHVTAGELLKAIVDSVVESLGADRGTLYLRDPESGELFSYAAQLPEVNEIRLPRGTGVAGHVAETAQPLLSADATADDHFHPDVDRVTGFTTRSMLTVPVLREGEVAGVLQVLSSAPKQFSADALALLVELAEQVAVALEQTSLVDAPKRELLSAPFNGVIGRSPVMQEIYRRVLAVAPTDATVLIRGESGTGKTLIARALHDNSVRAEGPMVHVDCASLPPTLIESELFGHERGAFTGADRQVQGKFERADGGTLFLDEIGDLPLALQGKLLRFLQDRTFERLGGRQSLEADVRIIAATNVDLEARCKAGEFREDLYYRIRVLELWPPPLRERGAEDLLALAEHFVRRFAQHYKRDQHLALTSAAKRALLAYPFPGNVRELEHCIESAVVLTTGREIVAEALALPSSGAVSAAAAGYPPGMPLAEVEQDHIQRTLASVDGNRSEAARLLGIGRNTLTRKLKNSG